MVFGGDQIHYGVRDKESLDAFQELVPKNLRMPYYMLFGNTEVFPVTGLSKLGREEYPQLLMPMTEKNYGQSGVFGWSGMATRRGAS